jgi:hypothetical protein
VVLAVLHNQLGVGSRHHFILHIQGKESKQDHAHAHTEHLLSMHGACKRSERPMDVIVRECFFFSLLKCVTQTLMGGMKRGRRGQNDGNYLQNTNVVLARTAHLAFVFDDDLEHKGKKSSNSEAMKKKKKPK